MPEITRHEPGMFSWADLTTTDAEGARAFYKRLFGWESIDNQVDEENFYTLFTKNEKTVCGMFQITPEMREQGTVTCWNAYVTVADTDATAAAALAQGATPIVEPMDVEMDGGRLGRMCVTMDSGGAVFSVWQPDLHIGAEVMGEASTFVWAELYTHDAEASAAFYTKVFGWEAQAVEGAGGIPYTLYTSGGAPAGGMLQIRPEWGEVPPNWTVYFAVESIEAAQEKVPALGGKVVAPAQSVPGIGTFIPVVDPQGGFLMLIELAPSE